MGVMCIRIGSCLERPPNARMLSTWISHRDMVQLTAVGLETPKLHYAVVYGISANTRGWWDNSVAFDLGYDPEDDSEAYAAEIMAMTPPRGCRRNRPAISRRGVYVGRIRRRDIGGLEHV